MIMASSLGEVTALDFDEETATQISFIRVKVKFGITDRFRFFRRVRFQSGERAMVGIEYEHLRRICGHCARINHQTSHCPYISTPIIPLDDSELQIGEESEAQVVPNGDFGRNLNNHQPQDDRCISHYSNMSSFIPISQPSSPRTPRRNSSGYHHSGR